MGTHRSHALTRSTALTTLNQPQLVSVSMNSQAMPSAVTVGKRRYPVSSVIDRWLIEEGWWRQWPTRRLYFRVELQNYRDLVLYRDLDNGQWWLQRDS